MNDMTQAVCEIMDMLDKSKLYKITYNGDQATIEIVTYNVFGKLNHAMINAGLGYVNFPYEVKLIFTIETKFAKLIEQEIEHYKGSLKKHHDRIMDSYKVATGNKCICPRDKLMIRGCTCGGN